MIEIIPEHKHKPKEKHLDYEQAAVAPSSSLPASPNPHTIINTEADLLGSQTPKLLAAKMNQNYVKPIAEFKVSLKSTEPSVANTLEQLNDLAKVARSGLSSTLVREIYKKKRLIEDRIFISETKEVSDYLKFIYQAEMDMKLQVRLSLQDLLQKRMESVKEEVQEGKMRIEQKERINKADLNDMLRFRERELKKKLGELRNNMEDSSLYLAGEDDRLESGFKLLDHQYYSKDHPKTKEVEEFIRRMREERIEIEKRREEGRRRMSELRQHQQEESEKSRAEQLSERHHKLVERFELKKELKEKEAEASARRQESFRNFMREYKTHKPLFRKKEEQYAEKVLQPQQERYQMQLELIKEKYRPINVEQLKKHEQRYLDFLDDNKLRKAEEVRMNHENRSKRQYFKGQYRYQVLEDMNKEREVEDPKLIERMKKVRQLIYADDIKSRFAPRIDKQKQAEMEQIKRKHTRSVQVRTVDPIQEDGYRLQGNPLARDVPQRAFVKDGLRNLNYLHGMIASLKREGKVKKKKTQPEVQTLEPRPNYLKELRQKKKDEQLSSPKISISEEHHKIEDIDQQERLRKRVELLDQHARLREKRIRLNSSAPSDPNQLENDYLESINAKLALLNSNELHID